MSCQAVLRAQLAGRLPRCFSHSWRDADGVDGLGVSPLRLTRSYKRCAYEASSRSMSRGTGARSAQPALCLEQPVVELREVAIPTLPGGGSPCLLVEADSRSCGVIARSRPGFFASRMCPTPEGCDPPCRSRRGLSSRPAPPRRRPERRGPRQGLLGGRRATPAARPVGGIRLRAHPKIGFWISGATRYGIVFGTRG